MEKYNPIRRTVLLDGKVVDLVIKPYDYFHCTGPDFEIMPFAFWYQNTETQDQITNTTVYCYMNRTHPLFNKFYTDMMFRHSVTPIIQSLAFSYQNGYSRCKTDGEKKAFVKEQEQEWISIGKYLHMAFEPKKTWVPKKQPKQTWVPPKKADTVDQVLNDIFDDVE